MARRVLLLLLLAGTAFGSVVGDVRRALGQDNFSLAEQKVEEFRRAHGVTAEMLEAHSWLGRGALKAKDLNRAERYSAETRKLALKLLESRELDAEKRLPIALGASIEVQAHVMAERGARSEAVAFLGEEIERWKLTSMRARIQKNIHLLSLVGKPAPRLDISEHIGSKPQPLDSLRGRVLLLYFWAHWCGDCRVQAPVLARLHEEFADKGLVLMGPTQRYGYAARGTDASPAEELAWIDRVRSEHYGAIPSMAVPLSQENFGRYGSSTTPTLFRTS